MSKKNKVVKLGSKNREKGRRGFVVYNGVEMTRAEREAFLRAQSSDRPERVKETKGPKLKKGTKVAEPRHSKLFNLLHPNRKQTTVPDLKSVDVSAYNAKKSESKEASKKASVIEEVPPVEKTEVVEEVDDASSPITISNAKKRISPNFVKRVGTISAKSCDELILEDSKLAQEIAHIDKSIAKAKTPKDASDETRSQLSAERKALRAKKAKLVAKRDINKEKAMALEKASDGYCDIYRLLTGNELSLRKTERINEYASLSSEQEQEVLDSLWAKQKG